MSDLYYLKRDDLLTLERMADKSVDNLLFAIEQSKKVTFEKLLFGLGIRFVGENVAKILVKHFKTIDYLIKADIEELLLVDEIGVKIAESLNIWFSKSRNLDLINRLKIIGFQFISNFEDTVMSNKLDNMKIIISGTFIKYERSELKKMIEDHGGKNVSTISKNTTFVLKGNDMGPTKKQKAIKLGIDLVSEDEFLAKLN